MHKNQSNDLKAIGIVLWQLVFSAAALYISIKGSNFIWFLGQLLLAVSLFQWFAIHHDMIHDSFFKTRFLNKLVGHISAIPTMLPFFSFKFAHHQHHVWTGWRDRDPSNPRTYFKHPPASVVKVANFCWKYWIPMMAPVFVIQNFWNIRRLFARFKGSKERLGISFSIGMVSMAYLLLFWWLPGFMLHNWLTGFVLYMMLSDLVLMSQHTHIDWQVAGDKEVSAFQYIEQSKYTRTIVYPKPVSIFLFYNFDKHGLHHQYPSIPTYQLGNLPPTSDLNVAWWEWLKKAKSMTAYTLLYAAPEESGVRL